jgi:dTDP-4-amino-4,6-dideoxygalactose transaminase
MKIPFNRPFVPANAWEYLRAAVESGHLSGDGPATRRCEAKLAGWLGAPRVLLTSSCTHALEMSALLLGLEPGDEVIVPAFTFVSTANAFALHGARPVFADIKADTCNIDEAKIEPLISPRTRALVVVHYGGGCCAMERIAPLADRHNLVLIEDAAHALFARYDGRPVGTFGDLAALSFHETKNLQCGEGGALVINRSKWSERAEILREKGTDRSRFFRGEVDRYTWRDVGSSYLASDLSAALLESQIDIWEQIEAERRDRWRQYAEELLPWANLNGVAFLAFEPKAEPSHHLFSLAMPSLAARDGLLRWLADRGVHATSHYVPLNATPQGRKYGGRAGQCPVAEAMSERLLRLPLFIGLAGEEQASVIAAVRSFAT